MFLCFRLSVEFLEKFSGGSFFCIKPFVHLKHFIRFTEDGIAREKLLYSQDIEYKVRLVVMG